MPAAKEEHKELDGEQQQGLLYVVTRPKKGCARDYHEWYDTEHGPLRMRLGFVRNGFRYREVRTEGLRGGGEEEEAEDITYMAMYDLDRVSGLEEAEYAEMRSHRSAREKAVLANKMELVDRRVYTLVSSRGVSKGPAPVVMAVTLMLERRLEGEVHRWYEEEHTKDLSMIPGWRRTRRYLRVAVDNEQRHDDFVELLAVHEFEGVHGLDGPEHVSARNRPWRNSVMSQVESRENRRWDFFHEFKVCEYRRP